MGYKKGESGNPAGKPRGAISKISRIRQQLYTGLPEVLEVVKRGALAGDPTMIRLWLDKILPNVKPVHAPAALPITATTPDSEAADLIYQSAVEGELDPDFADAMLSLLGTRRRLEADIAADEAQRQIDEIRAKLFSSKEPTDDQSSKA